MFSASGGEYHARLRRATGHVYSMTAITELEPLVDSCVQMFLSRLQTAASTNTPFEIDAWLQYYSFDCLGSLSFSEDVGFLSSGSDVGLMINAVDRIFDYVALVSDPTTERRLVSSYANFQIGQTPILDKLLLGNPLLAILRPEKQKSGGILNVLRPLDSIHAITRFINSKLTLSPCSSPLTKSTHVRSNRLIQKTY